MRAQTEDFKLDSLMAELGIPCECNGDMGFQCLSLASAITGMKALTFLDSDKYASSISEDIALVLTTSECADAVKGCSTCVCENPRISFFLLHNHLAKNPRYQRGRFKTVIGESCSVSPLAHIAEQNVRIGSRVVIEEFASIRENTTIGDDSVIRSGAVIGSEGFEHKRVEDKILSVVHCGGVVIGNHVEVQHNSAVDKAIYSWQNTFIGDYCKIDNLVYIAHAAHLERCVMVAALTCIAGRTRLGEGVWVGPGVTVINGIDVGDNARMNIGSVVTRDVPENTAVTGNFAIDHAKFVRNLKEANKS